VKAIDESEGGSVRVYAGTTRCAHKLEDKGVVKREWGRNFALTEFGKEVVAAL
jgi:Mn-dependent DtxR family transcriptional regulator